REHQARERGSRRHPGHAVVVSIRCRLQRVHEERFRNPLLERSAHEGSRRARPPRQRPLLRVREGLDARNAPREAVLAFTASPSGPPPDRELDSLRRIAPMGAPPDLSFYPYHPGIYLYKDAKGRIPWVGKPRSTRKRLASYFNAGPKHPKTDALLAEFATIDTVVATTESEALALENAFIKKHKARYNILLRDDKTYPYIKVSTGEDWPRAFVTRRVLKDGHSYFGPFLPARTCRGAMKMVQRMFQTRTCRIEIDGTLPRPCLYYDMHACLGPCVAGLTTKAAYDEAVKDVLLFLSGRNAELGPRLEEKMRAAAEAEVFEMAAAYRDCLRTVEELAEKQRVQSLSGEDVDVFGDFSDAGNLAVSILFVRGGVVLDSREYFWERLGDVPAEEFWISLLSQFYDGTTFLPHDILLPVDLPDEALEPIEAWLTERRGSRVVIKTPRRGAAFERVRIARDNAR